MRVLDRLDAAEHEHDRDRVVDARLALQRARQPPPQRRAAQHREDGRRVGRGDRRPEQQRDSAAVRSRIAHAASAVSAAVPIVPSDGERGGDARSTGRISSKPLVRPPSKRISARATIPAVRASLEVVEGDEAEDVGAEQHAEPQDEHEAGQPQPPRRERGDEPEREQHPDDRIRSPSPTAVTLPDCAADADPQRPAPGRRPLRAVARAGRERRARAARVAPRRTASRSGRRAADAIAVFGGGMNVADPARLPWLDDEIELLRDALDDGTPVLGVCLGAQLLAAAAGARGPARRAPRDRLVRRRAHRGGRGRSAARRPAGALHRLPVALVGLRAARRRGRARQQPRLPAGLRARQRLGRAVPPRGHRGHPRRVDRRRRQRPRRGRPGLRGAARGSACRSASPPGTRSAARSSTRGWRRPPRASQPQLELRRGLGRRHVEQLRPLDARLVDRGVRGQRRRSGRRPAARAARPARRRRARRSATRPPPRGRRARTGMRSWTGAQTALALVVRIVAESTRSPATRRASHRPANANGAPPSTV